MNTLVLWCVIVLFWLSFYGVALEHFVDLMPNSKIAIGAVILWLFVLWLLYEEILPRIPNSRGRFGAKQMTKSGVLLGTVAMFAGIFVGYREELLQGFTAVAAQYISYYNPYYGTNYQVPEVVTGHTAMAFLYGVAVIWTFLWIVAYGLRKKWILIGFTVLPIGMELGVGLSPMGTGVECFFVGALLLIALGRKDSKQVVVADGKRKQTSLGKQSFLARTMVSVLILVALLLSNVFYKEELTLVMNEKQNLIDLQEYVGNIISGEIQSMDVAQMIDLMINKEQLNNDKPRYTGEEVFILRLNQRPNDTIYLKGYQGNVYQDSAWGNTDAYFTKACEERNLDEQEVAKTLLQNVYWHKQNVNTLLSGLPINDKGISFTLEYEVAASNKAYLPHGTDYTSLDKEVTLRGDGIVQKAIYDRKISGIFLPKTWVPRMITSPEWGKYSWYDDVARTNNLFVPEELKVFFDTLGVRTNVAYQSDRLETAQYVKKYLESKMVYSLDLDELPADVDPIIYALTEGGEGYCMHFASAGTLILRYLGIPARYVSGYVVHNSAIEAQGTQYVASVKDYAAHAWVEIYINGIGWLPFEMTPGYEANARELPTESIVENSEDTETESQATETESMDTTETESQTDSETESELKDTEVVPQDTQGDDGPAGQEDNPGAMDGKIMELFKAGLVILAALGIFFGLWKGYRYIQRRYQLILQRLVDKKYTRRAVKCIHRRLYRYLRLKKGIQIRKLKDGEMESLLCKEFPQVTGEEWNQYMEIAKKSHYSMEDISEDEMMHCYACYQSCWPTMMKK